MSNKLTEREYEVASVAADLLMKGGPEYRIAMHCVRRGLTKDQTHKLMMKLIRLGALDNRTAMDVVKEYTFATTEKADPFIEKGRQLRMYLKWPLYPPDGD